MKIWLENDRCTGCSACANVCPTKAINMLADNMGFVHPSIVESLCVNCGLCEQKCPVVHPAPLDGNTDNPTIYAGWSLDGATRYYSTSGGVFSELCRSVYQRSGAVAGAIYDENQMVKHIVSDEPSDLERMRQSKYVQSEIDDVYQRVKERLGKGQTVLFSGCPCQVEGLLSVLGERHTNLYTVDFICRGSNSPKAYRRWLDMLEAKHGGKAVRVWFKNKETGWNRFNTRIDFDNGRVYREDRYHDLFMKGYLKHNLYIRPSCSNCQFKGLPRVADITLADFWGIDKKLDVDMGTSMVIVNNPHGKELLESAKNRLFLAERSLDEAVRGNKMIITSTWVSEHSGAFLQSLDSLPFDKAYRKIKPKLKAAEAQKSSRPAKKIKRVIRRFLSKLRG